ncbi:AAA family ATPase [Asaia spathodeae]|uniref:ATP-binding protein n=1 Tax=Asaia spathodeae TaxID=657016 RepID=UPI002FC3960A
MRFGSLDLIRYGSFSDRHYDFAPSPADLHVLHGANEAGKSTMLAAIGDLLFGFPNLKSQDWLFDAPLLRVGASLEQGDTRLDVVRKRGRTQTLLAPDDTTPLDENALLRWLGGVDRAAFERMWSLDHQRLRAGGDAMARFEGDLGQQLLAAGFGLENVQNVLEALDAQANAIWKKGGRGTQLNELKKEFDAARSQLSTAESARSTWTSLTNEASALESDRLSLEQRITALRQERSRLERLKRLRSALTRLDALNDALNATPAPLLTLQEHESFERLLRNWTEALQKRADLQHAHDGLVETRAGCQPDLVLLAQAEKVRDFKSRFEALGPERLDREEEASLSQLEAALQAQGHTGTAEEILSRLPQESLLERLRPLAKAHDALTLRETEWRRNHEAAQERLARAEATRGTARAGDLRPLQIAVQQAEALGDIDSTVTALGRACHEAEARMTQSLRDLLPWKGTPEALAMMALPEPGFLERQKEIWRERQKAVVSATEAAQALGDTRDRLLLDKAQLEQRDIISHAALSQERVRRDTLFDALMTAPHDVDKRADYLASRLTADQLADRRFDDAEESAKLTQIEQALERCILELAQADSRRDILLQAEQEAARSWQDEVEKRSLPILPPDRLTGWLELRHKALEAQARHQAAQADHDAAYARRAAMLTTLRGLLPDLTTRDTLADSLIEARMHLRDREKEAQRLAEREKECDLARREALSEQRKGEALFAERQALLARWTETLPGTEPWPSEKVESLEDARRKASILLVRRAALTARKADSAALEEAFRHFMVGLGRGEALALATAGAAMASLHEALLEAQRDKTQADLQDARIRAQTEACALADTRLDALRATFAPFMQKLGATEIETIRPVLDAEMRHYRDQEEKTQLERQIIDHSDGLDLAQLQAQAKDTDPALTETRLGAVESEQAELERQRDAAFSRGGEIRALLRDIEKDEAALSAAFDIESCRAKMARAAEEWATSRIQSLVLTHVAKRQRLENTNPLLKAAETIFGSLTCGRYQKLVISEDGRAPELAGMLRDEKMVRPSAMSEGTRDQLYLSLRLAALEQARARGLTLPFIADDLFITFDENRAEAGFATLARIAQHQQILFLTHHAHLAEMATPFGATRHSV